MIQFLTDLHQIRNVGSQINSALTVPFIAKTNIISAHARRSTSGITKFFSFVNDSGCNFSPIFTKLSFKVEFIFDIKRKYFARMRGSRISVFALYTVFQSYLAAPSSARHCVQLRTFRQHQLHSHSMWWEPHIRLSTAGVWSTLLICQVQISGGWVYVNDEWSALLSLLPLTRGIHSLQGTSELWLQSSVFSCLQVCQLG